MTGIAQKIRARQRVLHTVEVGGEELLFELLRPQAMHMIAAGMPVASFSHRRTVRERLETQQAFFQELANEEKKLGGFIRKLLAQCLIEPKFHDGPVETCPDDHVCIDYIEGIAGDLFEKLLELAGYREAEVAARVAEAFREDTRREAGDGSGEVPGVPAVGAPVGQPG